MTEQFRDAPIFDADQHMYDGRGTDEVSPERYAPAVQYTASSAVRPGSSSTAGWSDFIPNPTFERVAAPGAREVLRRGQHRGPDAAGDAGQGHRGAAAPAPGGPRQELDRQGVVEAINYPTLASLIEHATADDPELTIAVIHA